MLPTDLPARQPSGLSHLKNGEKVPIAKIKIKTIIYYLMLSTAVKTTIRCEDGSRQVSEDFRPHY